MFRKKWEVYRVIPQKWIDSGLGLHVIRRAKEGPYSRHWTRKEAEEAASRCDAQLRNGRSDEDFAAFKVRKRT